MSVFNGERYLRQAVESILNQDFDDFEFIIINDGSTDRTSQLLDRLVKRDCRLKVVSQPNVGLTKSLNNALRIARGKYIARMDADDLSEPTRLKRQVAFLNSNADHIAVGTSGLIIDDAGKMLRSLDLNANSRELCIRFLSNNFMIHGSVLFRNFCGIQYDESLRYAQDYDLWIRLLSAGKISNMPECLYKWRRHDSGISSMNEEEQKRVARCIAKKHLRNLLDQQRLDILLEAYLRGSIPADRTAFLKRELCNATALPADLQIRCHEVSKFGNLTLKRCASDFVVLVHIVGFGKTLGLLSAAAIRSTTSRLRRLRRPRNACSVSSSRGEKH